MAGLTGITETEKCPLCSSTEHPYKAGNYGHVGEITNPCPRVLADGRPCGLQHAFAGPLSEESPCRQA